MKIDVPPYLARNSTTVNTTPNASPSSPTTLAVRVIPRAKRNEVKRDANGALKVYVTAPPEDGRANDAVIETVADWLGVKRRQVRILTGEKSRDKVLSVGG